MKTNIFKYIQGSKKFPGRQHPAHIFFTI